MLNYGNEVMVSLVALQTFPVKEPAPPGMSPYIAQWDGPQINAGETVWVPVTYAAVLKRQGKAK